MSAREVRFTESGVTSVMCHAELVEAIAQRTVELLSETAPIGAKPLTVAEVANLLGRSPDYVRAHRHELGVLPATGTRPRLMFDPERVSQAMRASETLPPTSVGAEPKPHTRRLRRSSSAPSLLPIRGGSGA
jgi:hypothetical protein